MRFLESIWIFAMRNTALLIMPVIALAVSLVLLRIKKRYVEKGVIFGRSPRLLRDDPASNAAREEDMPTESHMDLSIALKKINELALADGDLGFSYWYEIGQLLQRANRMQAAIDALSKELERCHAMLRKPR